MDTNIVALLGANSGVRIEGENSSRPQAHCGTREGPGQSPEWQKAEAEAELRVFLKLCECKDQL